MEEAKRIFKDCNIEYLFRATKGELDNLDEQLARALEFSRFSEYIALYAERKEVAIKLEAVESLIMKCEG